MRKTFLLLALVLLVTPLMAGDLRFSAPFKSDPVVDDRSDFPAWIFARHFRANEPNETVFEEVALMPGENLWTVATRVYGDPELYPLLAMANPVYFRTPLSDREWLTLRVPRELPEALMAEARVAAWCPTFADAIGMRFDRPTYLAWMKAQKSPIQLASAR